jgi:biotin synthase-like enzyme
MMKKGNPDPAELLPSLLHLQEPPTVPVSELIFVPGLPVEETQPLPFRMF